MVSDIQPSSDGFYIRFAVMNGVLYFKAYDGVSGYELWKSDGTAEGTRLVRDILPGSAGSDPFDLVNINGTLFFSASDGTRGAELWRSDGTEPGTMLVRDINPAGGSFPSQISSFNGALCFTADNGTNGRELWRSDGTAAGTIQLRNIQAANAVTWSLVVKVNPGTPAGTVLSHTASVSSAINPDPVPANNSAITTTTVVNFNAPPALSNIEVARLVYVEGNPPAAITATLNLTDADSPSLAGATVAITGNYIAGEDLLGFTSQSGITGSFDPASGVLTLSGITTTGRYQSALRAVTYRNTSYFPSALQRTVSFQADDGALISKAVTRTVRITALDDTPRIVSIGPATGNPGTSRLTFCGIAGRKYTVEFTATLDPEDWQPLETVGSDALGLFDVKDTPPPGTMRRFYRARFP